MIQQSTQHILMVKPAAFGFNTMTAKDNVYQHSLPNDKEDEIHLRAVHEFDAFVERLQKEGVDVLIAFDSPLPKKSNAIFPNNWFTTHSNGSLILYPMYAENRRSERRRSIIDFIESNFIVEKEVDFSHYEADDLFLEGTGSMILDRINQICYACLSKRTDKDLLEEFGQQTNCKVILFNATDGDDIPIYHTNVMMAMASDFVIICLESIRDSHQKTLLLDSFQKTNKEVIDISLEQVAHFCGNVLEVQNQKGEKILVMSEQAYNAFNQEQKACIEQYCKVVYAPIYTIEEVGGGGTRCMMAEIFLPEKE